MKRIRIKDLLIKINRFNNRQWFLSSILTTTIGLWFPLIVQFFGIHLKFVKINIDGAKELTVLGIVFTIITVSWSFLSLTAQRYVEKSRNNMDQQNDLTGENNLFQSLVESVSTISEHETVQNAKYLSHQEVQKPSLLDYLNHHLDDTSVICEQMCKILSRLLSTQKFNMREQDLWINIYYKFPQLDSQWKRAQNCRHESGFSVNDLAQNQKSTFYQCINGGDNLVFHFSKKQAAESGHYVFDELDDIKSKDGSIACYYFEVKSTDTEFINGVVAISSYGKRFSSCKITKGNEEQIENIRYNLFEYFFKLFEPYITNALFKVYIKERLELLEATTKNKRAFFDFL